MATKIFDRETMLDLTVNFIPLFIILFFIVAFAVFNPFGFDSMATGIQYALLVAPFVFLAILTYISARAIAGDEKRSSDGVLPPGQAAVPGVEPLHHGEAESETSALEDEADDDESS
jgi:hypothetical protein